MSEKNNFLGFVSSFFQKGTIDETVENLSVVLETVDNTEFIFNPKNNNKIELIKCKDIIYITLDFAAKKQKTITIVTSDNKHSYCNSATDIFDFLLNNAECFRMINPDQLINTQYMHSYDSDTNKIYYSKDQYLIACTAAIKGFIKKNLGPERDRGFKSPRRESASRMS